MRVRAGLYGQYVRFTQVMLYHALCAMEKLTAKRLADKGISCFLVLYVIASKSQPFQAAFLFHNLLKDLCTLYVQLAHCGQLQALCSVLFLLCTTNQAPLLLFIPSFSRFEFFLSHSTHSSVTSRVLDTCARELWSFRFDQSLFVMHAL